VLFRSCWHDGTSLYATEHLWPIIEAYLRSGEHERIFLFLEHEADDRFGFSREAVGEGLDPEQKP